MVSETGIEATGKKEMGTKYELYAVIKKLIEESKHRVAASVNAELSLLYWTIGTHIKTEILQNDRGGYGKQIISSISGQLIQTFGNGWSKRQLHHCVRFAEIVEDIEIVHALRTQLNWTHIRLVIGMDDPLKRSFYIEMCKMEKWSTRTLQGRIKSMLYERTAISKKPEVTIKEDLNTLKTEQKISPDLVFRDPYFLDFLGLSDKYSEKDLETSILAELQHFIVELGSDFAFLSRQKRITIDDTDYYIDLLFYHRRLQALVAIDLKIGAFEAAYKGQMELYLRYLEKHETMEGENQPIGLILCTGKNEEHVELMQLDKSNIRIGEYLTILPTQEVLREKLHKAIEIAQSKLIESNVHKG